MKKIIVCDSGLGGLNIAAGFFVPENRNLPECELIYFNAYPAPGMGFNKLPSPEAREELFRTVLQSMEHLSPDLCLVACNTLSIVCNRLLKRFTPAFPVTGIVDTAVNGMTAALHSDPDSSLLILGTKSTIESEIYSQALIDRGFAPERIKALACPGLATLLESDPAAPDVSAQIAGYAAEAAGLFPAGTRRVYLGLCCTHFGFAGKMWLAEFGRYFPEVNLVNPNDLMRPGFRAEKCCYLSRIGFFPGAQQAMSGYFSSSAPQLSQALQRAVPDENLFDVDKKLFQI